MSKLKKFAGILLALVMCFGLTCTAFAADLTISNTNVGETYKVYQIFTSTSSDAGTTYYISTDSEYYEDVQNSNIFTTVATGDSTVYQVTWADTVTDDELLAELISFGAQGDAVKEVIAEGDSVTVEGLAAGYYYVNTTTGTAVSVGNNTDTVIADKNKKPVPTKTETTDGTAGIGDVVEFSVTIADAGDVDTLVYHDTMTSGLTFDSTSVVVKAGDTTLTAGTDYTVVIPNATAEDYDGCTFEVEFTDAGLAKITGSVTITYSATVNENAVESNGNTGKVSYGDAGESTSSSTETKVYDFDLNKTTSDGTTLEGASFTLSDDSGEIAFVAVSGGYRVATAAEIASTETETTTTISAGSVNIFGLDAGTYTLTETAAPAGYNQLTSALTVVIAQDGTVTISGNDNGSATGDDITVINNAGSVLPGTGGIGTTIFYVVGGALVVGAVVLLITKKRMSE